MLEIYDVHKSFGENEILKGIDFRVEDGEVVVIVGASGSGKTTLLRCMSFLEASDKGRIVFDGVEKDMSTISKKDIHDFRMKLGFVFQSFNLFNNMTALQNVMEGLVSARKMDKKRAESIAMDMLTKVGMKERANYYPGELSGGQQQRVAIARAIAPNPEVIFFDEPTSALDPELKNEVLDVIRNLAKEGTTMVIVTHEMKFARDVASRIVFIEEGRILEEGPVEMMFTSPKYPRTKEFLGLDD